MASRFTKILSADRFFWFPGNEEKKKYNPVSGHLLARTPRHDGKGYQYLLETTSDCYVKTSTKEIKKAGPGTHILVDERHQLSALEPLIREKMLYEVEITPKGKIPTKSGNNVWIFDVGVCETTRSRAPIGGTPPAPTRDSDPDGPDGQPVGDDDIPF